MVGLIDVLASFLVALAAVTIVFVVAYSRNRRYDLIDSAWGPLFVVIAWYGFFSHARMTLAGFILAIMVTVWGLRLSGHIFKRWLGATAEDPRYIELRQNWPKRAFDLQNYTRIYVVQALLATLVSLPVTIFMASQQDFNNLYIAGLLIWIVGFCFEVVSDQQLSQFIRSRKGELMTEGLWRYSRHPNYFGEITLWWGVAIMALSAPLGWLGVVGSITITVLIVFVSGVPPAERRMAKKEGWETYRDRTSVVIPLPRR